MFYLFYFIIALMFTLGSLKASKRQWQQQQQQQGLET
jgi:hypothetical protein